MSELTTVKPVIIGGTEVHNSVTIDRVMEAAQSEMFGTENPGICIECGADHDECEPDARRYPCHECGKRTVYGAAELLLMLA